MKSMLMSSPFHSTVRLPSCWYDVPVTSHTPFLGATKRLSAAFPRHYIRSTVAMSWLEYFIRCQPAICRADEHTTIPTYSRQSVTVHQPAGRHHAPSHPFFLRGLEKRAHYFNTAVFCCCCKLPAVKTKKKALHLKRLQLFLQQVGLIDLPDLRPSHSPLPLRAESFDVCVCVPN